MFYVLYQSRRPFANTVPPLLYGLLAKFFASQTDVRCQPTLLAIEGFSTIDLTFETYVDMLIKCLCCIIIFSRILPFGPEGPKWQDCFDTFCARAPKVQNKGWRSTFDSVNRVIVVY